METPQVDSIPTEEEIDATIHDVNTVGLAISRAQALVADMQDFHAQRYYIKQIDYLKDNYLFMGNLLKDMLIKYLANYKETHENVIPFKYRKVLRQLEDPFWRVL